jgi:hypothetical protein
MTSLYKNTKVNGYYRSFYEPIDIDYDSTDMIIIVTDEYNHKPGNLANDLYGNPRYSWIFRYFNPNQISDIIFDLKSGMILRVPTKERLLSKV